MKTLGIIGSNGMLGSDLVLYLSKDFLVTPISKSNYTSQIGKKFDVLLNANGNSKRFWAHQNVLEDFERSTVSVYKTLYDFSFDQYIYISSSDVYENHGSIKTTHESDASNVAHLSAYGFHKYISEKIIMHTARNYLIFRCSMMLGKNLKKGPIYDIIHNKALFISSNSRIQMITTKEVAHILLYFVSSNICNDVYNVGGKGSISFSEIQEYFNTNIRFLDTAEKQEYEMNIQKLKKIYPLHTSERYLKDFLIDRNVNEKTI